MNPVFEVLEKHGVGQVLSHWTWLPTLKKQWLKAGERFFNKGKEVIIRLMTPLGLRYEDAYAKAFPFNKLVEGMMQYEMVEETAELMLKGLKQKVNMNVIINNRAGGNAPMIAQQVSKRFLVLAKKMLIFSLLRSLLLILTIGKLKNSPGVFPRGGAGLS
jgi:hypothetical protein